MQAYSRYTLMMPAAFLVEYSASLEILCSGPVLDKNVADNIIVSLALHLAHAVLLCYW